MSPFYKNSITENELIKMCLRADRKAHKMFFDLYAGKLMTICRRYGRTTEEAEDMLQESFIRIFSNLSKFNSDGSLEGWVRRITVNTSIKYLQKKSNRKKTESIEGVSVRQFSPNKLDLLQAEDLMLIINKLPDGYRAVFNLYEIEGYSHKEVADLLKISESTSRSQLTKAKKMLRQFIPHYQRTAI